jgi:hypothetical protein
MKTRKLRSTIVAVTLLAAALPSTASGGKQPLKSALEGTWEVTIMPVNCSNGDPFPQFSALSYLSFNRGGTMIETTSNPRFQPGQRSAGLGYWEYTGGRKYFHAVFKALIQFDSVDPVPPQTPYVRGTQTIDQTIEMQDRDHWTSDALVTFRDPAGEKVSGGCASASAVRMP